MNSDITIKQNIENPLKHFDNQPLRDAATKLLNTLGYYSKRVGNDAIDTDRFNRLVESALDTANPSQKLRVDDWQSFFQIMQVADAEINQQIDPEQGSLFESTQIDDTLRTSYMFVAVQLTQNTYTRTQLADITRFINKAYNKPIMVMFRYGIFLTLAIINRRHHKRDPNKQVLEKVTLIKDIHLDSPKRAHIDILAELDLPQLIENEGVRNFDTLHDAWERILNTEALNRRFYRDLEAWYEWAAETCQFPDHENDMQVIRMITRLLFIWFLKEKSLVPENIFQIEGAAVTLNNFSLDTSDYYQGVLQNLFFATLNTPIHERGFSKRNASTHRDGSKYRYADLFQEPDAFLEHLKQVPFVNGGLFDCLDTFEATGNGGLRVDCFTDNENDRSKLQVPAKLFFDAADGIFPIFSRYKFTVEENTPIEQEVALDPELLGQVFENLLGAHNPETQSTARKATGSYYTSRQIVDYMVDEALIAYFLQKVPPGDGDTAFLEERLREDLLAYDQLGEVDTSSDHLIYENEIKPMIEAINDLKIIDPAVGSGAFPMGILNKLVLILKKLDPENRHWKAQQVVQAENIPDPQSREVALAGIDAVFSEANQYNNYGRKLYLIQNCIYGVDIQPIAITIAKLRFFISLIIEQKTEDTQGTNYGVRPLPNLETKFVAANTLIGLKELNASEFQLFLENDDIQQLRQEIAELRDKNFTANTRQIKLQYIQQEKECKDQLAEALATKHTTWCKQKQNRIEQLVTNVPQENARQQLREQLQKEYTVEEAKLTAALAEANRIAHWNAYDQNAVADFFEPEWMFGIADGFDVVIGNPPYIQLQKDNGKLGKFYQDAGFETFVRTGDIYCLFYEKTHQLLKNNGHACLITSNKWMRAGYGKKLRDYFVMLTQPIQLLDMGPDVFDATVDTNILLFQKTVPDVPAAFRGVSLGADFDRQTGNIAQYLIGNGSTMEMPAKGEPWTILSTMELALKRKIEKVGKPLKDWDISINLGIKTGCNEAFIIDESKKEELIDQNPKSAEIIRPLLRGRDIERYHSKQAGLYLLATGYDLNIPRRYPAIYDHLEIIGEQIESGKVKAKGRGLFNRTDQGENWWNLRACAYYSEFDNEKVVWGNIAYSSSFCYSEPAEFITAPANILTSESNDIKYLLACMNSKIFNWEFSNLGIPLGYAFEWKKQYVELIHVPSITDDNREIAEQIEDRVEKILVAKKTDSNADTTELENEIDKLVYELYNLTEEEIAIVEKSV